MRLKPRPPFAGLLTALLLCALAVLAMVAIPREAALWMLGQKGPLDIATVAVYLLGAILYWRMARTAGRGEYRGGLLLFLLAMVELSVGVWQAPFDLGPRESARPLPPPEAKVIAVAVLAVMLFLFVTYAVRKWPGFRAAIRERRQDAWFVLAAIALFPTAMTLQIVQSNLSWYDGYRTTHGPKFTIGAVEETLELAIPTLLLTAIILRSRRRARSG